MTIGFCDLLLFVTVLPNINSIVTGRVLMGISDLSEFVTIWSLSNGSHKIRP